MTLSNKLSVLAFAGFSAAAGATGTPSGYPSTPVSVTNTIQINNPTNVNGNVGNSVSIGAQSGSSATDNSMTVNNINVPPPKIIEIPAFMGSCRGSKWQSFFQDAVVNAVHNRPAYGPQEVSARSISIRLDRQRSESEMSEIAAFVQDKITPKPIIRSSSSDAFHNSSNTNVTTSGNATGGNAVGGITNVIGIIPTEVKIVKYFCSDFDMK